MLRTQKNEKYLHLFLFSCSFHRLVKLLMSFSYVCVGSHSSRSLLSKADLCKQLDLVRFLKRFSPPLQRWSTATHPHHELFSLLASGRRFWCKTSRFCNNFLLQTAELITGLCCTLMYTLITVIFLIPVAFLHFILVSVFPAAHCNHWSFILFSCTHVHTVYSFK